MILYVLALQRMQDLLMMLLLLTQRILTQKTLRWRILIQGYPQLLLQSLLAKEVRMKAWSCTFYILASSFVAGLRLVINSVPLPDPR